MKANEVVIVGGGISGLAVAWCVGQAARRRALALQVTVFESNSRPGGRIATDQVDGFHIEHGANGFLDAKPSTIALAHEIGLEHDLIAAQPEAKNRYILWNERLQPLPTGPMALLRSGLLSWRGKIRLLAEPFIRAGSRRPDESVHEFACRRIGREAAEVLVDAMVTGIHAGDATLLSAAAAFPHMVQLEQTYGSLLRAQRHVRRARAADPGTIAAHSEGDSPRPANRAPRLWSLRLGMGQLIERLAERCGAELMLGAGVRSIERDAAGHWFVAGAAGRRRADALVLACPSFAQASLLEPVDPELATRVAAIPYNAIAVVALGFRAADVARPLDGFGYLQPQRSRRDVLGVLWSSSIFAQRAPDGLVLVQAMCGGWNRPDMVHWSDEQIVRSVLDELRQTIGTIAPPVLTRVIRWPQAIPQYHIGHLQRVAEIEQRRGRLHGLFLTGNAFRGVSVNDCTEEASRCANEVIGYLESARPA